MKRKANKVDYVIHKETIIFACNKAWYLPMKILQLQCISEINVKDVIGTSTFPFKIMASDYDYYLCKHALRANTEMLFNEYISAYLLKLSNIDFPNFGFVNIDREQVNEEVIKEFSGITYRNFSHPLFCVRYLEYAKESDDFIIGENKQKRITNKIANFDDLARIALFDVWMSNEDRTLNNNNLLISPVTKNNFKLIPIDHGCVFNTMMAKDEMFLINEYDTIMNSKLFSVFLQKHNKAYCVNLIEEITKEFKHYVANCEKHKNTILRNVPATWHVNIKQKSILLDYLFSESWINESINQFKQFFTLKLNNK